MANPSTSESLLFSIVTLTVVRAGDLALILTGPVVVSLYSRCFRLFFEFFGDSLFSACFPLPAAPRFVIFGLV